MKQKPAHETKANSWNKSQFLKQKLVH